MKGLARIRTLLPLQEESVNQLIEQRESAVAALKQ
ncbi:hypothetical protein VINE108274_11800 [Vibrio neptunius]